MGCGTTSGTTLVKSLVEFAVERESIRIKKERGEAWPYTQDWVLQKYRFTNIRRKDDRVSRWLINNVYTPENISIWPIRNLILITALCRLVNWPPTIKLLMDLGYFTPGELDFKGIGAVIDGISGKRFTGSYMVRAQPGYGGGKGGFVAEEVVGNSLKNVLPFVAEALATQKRQKVWEALMLAPNTGSFGAGQVVDDLTWTPLLKEAVDHYTWAPKGPGSMRGYNRLMERPLRQAIPEEEWAINLQLWWGAVVKNLNAEFGGGYDDFTMMDLQNCLCETDKMLRVRTGEGKPRSTYRPEQAY